MSDVSTLEKIKESEDTYAKSLENAKAESEAIIKRARAEAEIELHDSVERATELADSIKVKEIENSKKKSKEIMDSEKEKISLLKDLSEEYIIDAFSKSIEEIF